MKKLLILLALSALFVPAVFGGGQNVPNDNMINPYSGGGAVMPMNPGEWQPEFIKPPITTIEDAIFFIQKRLFHARMRRHELVRELREAHREVWDLIFAKKPHLLALEGEDKGTPASTSDKGKKVQKAVKDNVAKITVTRGKDGAGKTSVSDDTERVGPGGVEVQSSSATSDKPLIGGNAGVDHADTGSTSAATAVASGATAAS